MVLTAQKRRMALSLLLTLALAVGMLLSVTPPLPATAVEEAVPAYYVLDDCDTQAHYASNSVDDAVKVQGVASLKAGGNGDFTMRNGISFKMAAPAELASWYLELWLYVDDTTRVNMANSYIELKQDDKTLVQWKLSKLDLVNGWNKIQAKIQNASVKKGLANLTEIKFLSVKMTTTRPVNIRLDDICLSKEETANDLTVLNQWIATADELAAGDLSGYDPQNVKNFKDTLATAKSYLSNRSQRDVDVVTENLKKSVLAFGMEGYTEDLESSVAYIDFHQKTYSKLESFSLLNKTGDGIVADHGGKGAAAFDQALRLAVSSSYIGSNDCSIRVNYTYYDAEAGSLSLHYNSTEAADAKAEEVTFAGSGKWVRRSIRLDDAALAHLLEGKDIGLNVGAGTAYVTRVEIKLITADDLTESAPPTFPQMTDVNNFKGKSVAGYQMWFRASEGQSGWVHWAGGNIPSNGRISFEQWPDTSEYPDSVLENTAFNNLGDGRPAQLFTSAMDATVDVQVSWMKEYGVDGFAIQRFYGTYLGPKAEGRTNLDMAKDAAEKYDRLFYIMYDLNYAYNDGMAAAERLKIDFVNNIEGRGLITSPSYAQMDGKPVVCMWGLDPTSTSYANHDATLEFINWLKERGYFVVGGTSNNVWADETDEDTSYDDVYQALDMISPWTVGRYNYNGVLNWMNNNVTKHMEYCEKYGIAYQPVVLAGSAWHNHNYGAPNDTPRLAGEFLWRQATKLKSMGAGCVYFAMYDEYDEATAFMKGAQDSYDIPQDEQYFYTYASDGYWLSSDFYLRMAGSVAKLMRDEIEMTEAIPQVYSEGPIYWRNSFEYRWTPVYKEIPAEEGGGREQVSNMLAALDVGADYMYELDNNNVEMIMKEYECSRAVEYPANDIAYKAYGTNAVGTGIHCDSSNTRTTNGSWSLQFNGKALSKSSSYVKMQIAFSDFMVSAANLQMTYQIFAENDLGKYVYIDLVLDDGRMLSDVVSAVKKTNAKVGEWTEVTIDLPTSLIGQQVTNVLICYDHGAEGEFNAFVDGIIIESKGTERQMLQNAVTNATAMLDGSDEQAALKAAVDAANTVMSTNTSTNKDRLNAVKAIDRAIRELEADVPDVTLGDVDGNGAVDSSDARMILQYSVKKIELDETQQLAADVNSDFVIDSSDARAVLQYAVGKLPSFG